MPPAEISDEELLERYRSADVADRRRLAGMLFERHYARVAGWCLRFTGDRDAASDLAQDVFMKAHQRLDSFRSAARISTWLYSIVRHEALNRARGQSRHARRIEPGEEALVDVPAAGAGPDDLAERRARTDRINLLLRDTLDETERTVFTLHFGDELPLEAITRLLRLDNPSGAKAYIVSAKRKLARAVRLLRARGEAP